MKNISIKLCGTVVLACLLLPASAQMPDDGFTMGRGELCLVAGYKQSQWKEYWEGKRLRENLNIGTFSSKAFTPMVGFGVTDKLNLFAALPYISNNSDAGTMTGKKGFQDFSMAAKYHLLDITKKKMRYALFGTAGFSLPATNYVPDYLPYSIGIGSKTASLRMVAHVVYKDDFFATVQGGYNFRSNITVDRQTYYTDAQHYSNEMKIPDMWDGSIKLGYDNHRVRTNVHYMLMNSTSGSDIRRNDMPYPGNKMDMQAVGVDVLLWVPKVKGLGILASADKTIAGRNMGKAFTWMAGAQYVFRPFQKKKVSEENTK
ncbi:MAG: hypothetical protein V4717_22380 [Bacteroidota bacterium]